TLSLPDALPISRRQGGRCVRSGHEAHVAGSRLPAGLRTRFGVAVSRIGLCLMSMGKLMLGAAAPVRRSAGAVFPCERAASGAPSPRFCASFLPGVAHAIGTVLTRQFSIWHMRNSD